MQLDLRSADAEPLAHPHPNEAAFIGKNCGRERFAVVAILGRPHFRIFLSVGTKEDAFDDPFRHAADHVHDSVAEAFTGSNIAHNRIFAL